MNKHLNVDRRFFTDLCNAGASAVVNNEKPYLEMRNDKVEAIKQAVMKQMMLFGSNGRC